MLFRSYSASNYHDLVDMPFFVGQFDVDSAQISGTWVRLATYPSGSLAGGPRVAVWEALKLVIPGIVNSFIALFKDTTLVLIVAIFDLLGQVRAAFSDPNWATPVTLFTGFAFAGIIYFVFTFAMSRYALYTERRLYTGGAR